MNYRGETCCDRGYGRPFLASSNVGPCDVPYRYASRPIPRYRGTVARWHDHLHGLATVIHEISGLQIACFPFAATIPPAHQALLALGHWHLYLHDLAAVGATLAFKTVEFIGYFSNLKTAEASLSG